MSFYTNLINAMEDNGYFINGYIDLNSSKFQRFSAKGKKGSKDIFVKIQGNLDGATFGDWHNHDTWVTWWERSYKELCYSEKLERNKIMADKLAAENRQKEHAELRARSLWAHKACGIPDIDHPYLIAKRLWRALYIKQVRGCLVIPLRDIDYNLVSLQFIKKNGFKRFKHGASFNHRMCWLSEPLADGYSGVIRVCEGYSTGNTIYEAVGAPVICAMNASNLVNVCRALKYQYPYAILKICADNDACAKENVGLKYALMAAKETGASSYWPEFKPGDQAKKPSDFNDLLCLYGLEEVEKQLLILRK